MANAPITIYIKTILKKRYIKSSKRHYSRSKKKHVEQDVNESSRKNIKNCKGKEVEGHHQKDGVQFTVRINRNTTTKSK